MPSRALLVVTLAMSLPAYAEIKPMVVDKWKYTLETGAGTLSTREGTEAFLSARVTAEGPITKRIRGMARGDLDRSQDPESPNLKSFQSVEAAGNIRYYVYPGWSIGLHGAATYQAPWGAVKASDSRLRTLMMVGCVDVPPPDEGRGCLGGGWRGPAGGWSISAIASRSIKGVTSAVDIDVPLKEIPTFFASGGKTRIYTVRVRAIVRIKRV